MVESGNSSWFLPFMTSLLSRWLERSLESKDLIRKDLPSLCTLEEGKAHRMQVITLASWDENDVVVTAILITIVSVCFIPRFNTFMRILPLFPFYTHVRNLRLRECTALAQGHVTSCTVVPGCSSSPSCPEPYTASLLCLSYLLKLSC